MKMFFFSQDEDDAPARNSFREISFGQLLRNPNGVDHFQSEQFVTKFCRIEFAFSLRNEDFLKKIDAGDLLDFLLIVQVEKKSFFTAGKFLSRIFFGKSFQFIKSEKFDEDSFRAAAADVIDRFLLPTVFLDDQKLKKTFFRAATNRFFSRRKTCRSTKLCSTKLAIRSDPETLTKLCSTKFTAKFVERKFSSSIDRKTNFSRRRSSKFSPRTNISDFSKLRTSSSNFSTRST